MAPKNDPDRRVLLANRKARHEYEVLETIEAGLVLVGTEVKSLRAGKANMGDAYAMVDNGEAWLLSLHISPYTQAHQFNHDPMRRRKLLLHKAQINRLRTKIQEKGLTLVPMALVLVENHVKVELALARGRKLHDKREATEKKDVKREVERALRDRERHQEKGR
jgi:SsrA-binding protein